MLFNEIRKDYLLNRWVVIAIERSRRPTDFKKPKKISNKQKSCPLCVGNENLTPPAVLLYLKSNNGILKQKDDIQPRKTNWLIRVVPNLFPAFSFSKNKHLRNPQKDKIKVAFGHHEVLVESPIHDDNLAVMKNQQLINLINAYIDRLESLSHKPYVKHVQIFRNYGKEAGASLTHAHSQIIAMPIIPRILKEEITFSRNYFNKNKECVFCKIIEREKMSKRLIFQNNSFITFAPFASVHPLEFWIVPKRHDNTILNLELEEKKDFIDSLKKGLSALRKLVNDPPYNYGFHLSIDKKTKKYYHWHLEIYPKLSVWAGFEKSTGVYINTISPEKASLELRKHYEI